MPNPYNYFPASYNAAYNPYQQINQNQQIQQAGLVSVRNRAEAESYPIAPGNSVTFKDETAPYIYVKTMGFSQLDRPSFDVFRLIKEDAPKMPENGDFSASKETNIDLSLYAKKAEIEALNAKIEAIEDKLTKRRKKESDDDA